MAQQSSLLSVIGTSGVLLVGSRYCPLCPARAVVVRRSLGSTRTTGAHTFFIASLTPEIDSSVKGQVSGVRPAISDLASELKPILRGPKGRHSIATTVRSW